MGECEAYKLANFFYIYITCITCMFSSYCMVENIAIFTELLLCIGGGKGKKDLNAKKKPTYF